MPRVVLLERQPRRRRVSVHLDDGSKLDLRLDVVASGRLSEGIELGDDACRALEAESQRLDATAAALRLLAVRPRSERDLRDRLQRRGFGRALVQEVMQRMRALGYLDDAAFARGFVEARQAAMPRSRRALSFELSQRGVDREVALAAVEGVSDEEAAYEAARRRLRSLSGLDRATFTRRLGAFLASRGFGYGASRAAIDRCWAEASGQQ